VAPTEPSAIAVCDAGPLIHLDELGSLDLLNGFEEVLIPDQVCDEVARHRPQALEIAREWQPGRIEISKSPKFQALMSAFSLGAGEQAALTMMVSCPEAILLCDDAAARLVAKTLGFRSQGTLGVLLRAIRQGQRSQAQVLGLLREIPVRSTLHIKASLLKSVIEEVERGGAAT
jgi:predicted nucleic acid-binding protein